MQVDGPSHFTARGRRPLGATLLKRRQLRACGLCVVSVPYWRWAALGENGSNGPRPGPSGAAGAAAAAARRERYLLDLLDSPPVAS